MGLAVGIVARRQALDHAGLVSLQTILNADKNESALHLAGGFMRQSWRSSGVSVPALRLCRFRGAVERIKQMRRQAVRAIIGDAEKAPQNDHRRPVVRGWRGFRVGAQARGPDRAPSRRFAFNRLARVQASRLPKGTQGRRERGRT